MTIRTGWAKWRSATLADWEDEDPVVPFRTIAVAIDTHRLKAGDGVSTWSELPYLEQAEVELAVDAAVAALVDSAPGTLNTLNELAAALADDPSFATTITAALATKATTTALSTETTSRIAGDAASVATAAADATSKVAGEAAARATADALLIPLTQRGAASGVATLDGSGTVPDAQIPSTIARDTEVAAAVAALVNSAPGTLDTLAEIATALGSDPNLATTLTNLIALKAAKAGDTFTGEVIAPDFKTSGKTGATATPSILAGGTASAAPTTGAHVVGELVTDATGGAWYCTVAGTPGTWVRVNKTANDLAYAPSVSRREYASENGVRVSNTNSQNAAALQALADGLASAGGGEIVLDEFFAFNGPFNQPAKVVLEGIGYDSDGTNAVSGLFNKASGQPAVVALGRRAGMRRMALVGSVATGDGLQIDDIIPSASSYKTEEVFILNHGGYGVNGVGTSNDHVFDHTIVQGNTLGGYYFPTQINAVTMVGGRVYNNGGPGMDMSECLGVTAIGTAFELNTKGWVTRKRWGPTLLGCYFEGNTLLDVDWGTVDIVLGGSMIGCNHWGSGGIRTPYAVNVQNAKGLLIAGGDYDASETDWASPAVIRLGASSVACRVMPNFIKASVAANAITDAGTNNWVQNPVSQALILGGDVTLARAGSGVLQINNTLRIGSVGFAARHGVNTQASTSRGVGVQGVAGQTAALYFALDSNGNIVWEVPPGGMPLDHIASRQLFR